MAHLPKRRIVAVITHNDRGGAQEALGRLCLGLSNRGHDIELWYLYKKGNDTEHALKCRFIIEKEKPTAKDYFTIIVRLNRMLRQEKPDATLSFLPLANTLAQTLSWLSRIRVRVASQRNPVQTYGRFIRFLDWYVGTCGSYTHNIGNSTEVRSSILGYPWPYRLRTHIIHNGVASSDDHQVDRPRARAMFNIPHGSTALVSVGRLTKQKNHIFLIQLLGALKDFTLLIAGNGEELPKLHREAELMGVEDRVQFLGPLKPSEIKTLLDAADIFALPSLYEGQSNALLEAMSAGKPIVTNDLPSHRETLLAGNAQAGITIPITDPKLWISVLSELGSDLASRHKYGQRAKERVRFFTLDRMCSSFEAVLAPLPLRSD